MCRKAKGCFGCNYAHPLYRFSPLGFMRILCKKMRKEINEGFGFCQAKEKEKNRTVAQSG